MLDHEPRTGLGAAGLIGLGGAGELTPAPVLVQTWVSSSVTSHALTMPDGRRRKPSVGQARYAADVPVTARLPRMGLVVVVDQPRGQLAYLRVALLRHPRQ